MQNDRLERLRSELADLRARESFLASAGHSDPRGELASLRVRILSLEDAIAEAENLSLTGDGTARP